MKGITEKWMTKQPQNGYFWVVHKIRKNPKEKWIENGEGRKNTDDKRRQWKNGWLKNNWRKRGVSILYKRKNEKWRVSKRMEEWNKRERGTCQEE